jgi:hypothetical protein
VPRHICILVGALVSAIAIVGCGGGSESTSSGPPFEPQASLRAVGGTDRGDKPEFVIRVVPRPGDAKIRSAAVNLPPVVLVDATAISGFCSERELQSDDCAGKRRLGSARVLSPAFEGVLSGPVFAVTGSGTLPRLAYVLSGPADVLLRGRIVSKGGRIQAGVEDVPKTPLKSFELTIDGGKRGYLILSRNICKADALADGTFTSQAGQLYEQEIPLEADCRG